MSRLNPVPHTPLRDNPTEDAIWKRYLEQLWLKTAGWVSGPTSSTDNSVPRFNGTDGIVLQGSSVIIDDSNNVSGVVNLTTTGNTILGDASGDTLTINAGTWTIGSNFTATRAAGTVASGIVNLQSWNPSATGDSGGTSNIKFNGFNASIAGANALAGADGLFNTILHGGSATVTLLRGGLQSITLSSTGGATNSRAYQAAFSLSSSGSVTTGDGFFMGTPTLSSTGTFTTLNGFRCVNIGHATLVNNAIGFECESITASATLTVSFRSQQNSGTGVWGFLHTGTANNAFNGNVRIGSTTAPTVTLDVTGNSAVSGTSRLGAYTVATLPAAGTAGRTAYVTDALLPAYLAVVAGGGAVVTPVFDNGANWITF